MKNVLYASSLVLLTVAESTGLVRYGAVGEIIVLPCKNNGSSKEQRWRRDSTFLSFGFYINTKVLDNARFKIVGDINIEYNLQISNARLEDFGAYWCEIQIKEHVSRTKVILQRIERYPVFTKQCTKKGTAGFTVESTEYSTYDSSSIQFNNQDSPSTRYGTIDIEEKETGSNANQYYIYGSFAAGLVLVLCLSIGFNTFYRRRVQSAQTGRQSEIQNTFEEYVNENANTIASNVENAYFSNYELIDENNMIELSNPNFQITTSNRIARQTSSSLSDRQYLEVVDDKDHSLPLSVDNEEQSYIFENSFSSKEEIFNFNSYESTEKQATCISNSINKTNDNPFKSIRTVPIDRSTSSKSGESTSSDESEVVILKDYSEYLNPYAFLNTHEVDFSHSYCTLITSAPAEGFVNCIKLSIQQKRHSYP